MDKIKITFNDYTVHEYRKGTLFYDASKDFNMENIVGYKINNEVFSLDNKILEEAKIEFINTNDLIKILLKYQDFKTAFLVSSYLEYDVKNTGLYTFYLNNYHNSDDSEVNFAINLGQPSDKLGAKKLDKISGILHDIKENVNNMRTKQGLINKKTQAHNDSVNRHNSEILIYSIIEVFVLIAVFVAQTIYIKKLINKV